MSELAKHLDPLHDPARCDVCAMRAAFEAMREALRRVVHEGAVAFDYNGNEEKVPDLAKAIDKARAALALADKVTK